ncbi:MAG: deoxyhypusine synthase [Candidatus Thermoplasmatota archaeon]|nr:deoxyhypusine synthase [Candidatus Thermoplasmatota archaeon]
MFKSDPLDMVPMKSDFETPPVEDIDINTAETVQDLLLQFGAGGGFTAKKLSEAASIVKDMITTDQCYTFLSFPACIISTGCRGVIKELVKRKWVDCIITTSGTLDHDLARIWKKYHHGSFEMDDTELYHQGVHRLGNILIPIDSYGLILEKKMREFMEDIWEGGQREFSTREIVHEVGKRLDDESSITYWAAKNDIPVFLPGPTDGAFGSQLWMWRQTHPEMKLDLFKDEQELANIVFDAKETGALMIGGGISKHHVIWWNQFRDGLDHAVYITTAVEWDGSLSGARMREAISWGKLKETAPHITVEGDATILLPLMMTAVRQDLDGGGD